MAALIDDCLAGGSWQDEATRRLAGATSQQVVVLLSAGDWDATRRAATAFDGHVRDSASSRLRPVTPPAPVETRP